MLRFALVFFFFMASCMLHNNRDVCNQEPDPKILLETLKKIGIKN